MTDARPDIRDLFCEAIEKSSTAELQAFLDTACAGDSELRGILEELLHSHQEAGKFLGGTAPGEAADDLSISADLSGIQIGPYTLREKIGEGGMGIVYLAEQAQPVKRKVAIKVIKAGMDSRQVIARFEAERQALALMEHVNIARVLDAGATPSGRPYFVMELVHGVAITQFCDDNRQSLRQRLDLFIAVCHAIQHAHQKGIIHRDIKPSNVIVTFCDGKPVPKVIDFGVAKAVEQNLTEQTLLTQFGTMVGTLEYMSPEQAEFSAKSVDTRSDVYSLGVLLYELLSGSTPLSVKRIKEVAFAEILRIIKDEEPPKPSTRLSESGESLASISDKRQSEPAKLTKLIRGELDWIVLKALEKDRARRYESATALAADVQRYLRDETVQACPPSALYRLTKFARGNKPAFATAAALMLLMLLTVVGLAISNGLIRQEQSRTQDERDRAEKAQSLAELREHEVREGLVRLKAANVWLERGRWHMGRRRWDDANAAFSQAIELRPDHVSAWRERSEMMAMLGLFDRAAADFAREFELPEPLTTMHWYRFALLQLATGDQAGWRDVRRRMRNRFHGTPNRDFSMELVRTSLLAADEDVDYPALVKTAEFGLTSEPGSWYLQYLLGIALYRAGSHDQAAQHLQASLSGGPEWEVRALSYVPLAMAYHRLGRTTEARQALKDAASAIERWTTQRYKAQDWSQWEVHQGAVPEWPIAWWDWLECQLYYREAMLLIEGAPPPDDPRIHVLRARSLAGLRQNFAADVEFAAALKLNPNDGKTLIEAHRSAGYSAVGRMQWSRAAAEFRQAAAISPDDSYLRRFQGVAHLAAGEIDQYQTLCRDILDRFEGTDDWRAAGNVVFTCVLRADAVTDPSRLVSLAQRAAPWPHLGAYVLAASLHRAGNHEEAIRCFEGAERTYRPQALEWSFLAMAHHRLGHDGESQRCLAEATQWIEEANHGPADDLSDTRPVWGSWSEMVAYPLLLREAKDLAKIAESTARNSETRRMQPK